MSGLEGGSDRLRVKTEERQRQPHFDSLREEHWKDRSATCPMFFSIFAHHLLPDSRRLLIFSMTFCIQDTKFRRLTGAFLDLLLSVL